MNNTLRDETERGWEQAWRRANDPLAPRWHRQASRLTWGLVTTMPMVLATMALSSDTRVAAGLGVLTLLWTGFVVIMMAGFVTSSNTMPGLEKVGWLSSFVFFAPLALPVFWLRRIWDAPFLEPQLVRFSDELGARASRERNPLRSAHGHRTFG